MARDYQLPHIITRWRPISTDMYGKSTYSVAVIRCRYQTQNDNMLMSMGLTLEAEPTFIRRGTI